MRPWLRDLLLLALAFAAGAWAWRTVGDVQLPRHGAAARDEPWTTPPGVGHDLKASDRLWAKYGPWGLPPPPPPAPPPPPPPPAPVPVGIIARPGGLNALFVLPGGAEFQVPRGGKIPGGGRLVAISRVHITWIDRDGKKREQELLGDPMSPIAPGGP
jgi:hypothetical protein